MKKIKFSRLLEGKTSKILLWVIVFILLAANNIRFNLNVSLMLATISLAAMLCIYYLNKIILIPRFLETKKNRYYLSFSIISILVLTLIFTLADIQIVSKNLPPFPFRMRPQLHEGFGLMPFFKTGFLVIGAYLISTLIHMVSRAKEEELRTQQIQNESNAMELKFLKSQINPHFLFNALNNIYSMIYTGDKNAANSVLKLSELLRYVTDDCQAETIPIEKEVQYIENYIEFQQIRMEKQMNVTFVQSIANRQLMIPPMLFQPFVENCFKHSRIENDPSAHIHLSLTENNNQLLFVIENSKPKNQIKPIEEKRNGIGIANVNKRLELLFPNKHNMIITDEPNSHRVQLHIELSNEEKTISSIQS